MTSKIKPSISIILAAHREGRIAHKTLKSLAAATQKLDEANISYEVLVSLDNPDAATTEYFENQKVIKLKTYEMKFGDLAKCRNFLVDKAEGEFCFILDADDLISSNWLIKAYRKLSEQKKDQILHQEFSINFGTKDIVWHKFNSLSKELEAIKNVYANQWDSAIATKTEILKRFPYQPNTKGHGSEDWHFNCQTLAAGIPHNVVEGTVLFVRRKDTSEMTRQNEFSSVIHYNELNDFDFIKSIDPGILPKQHRRPSKLYKFKRKTLKVIKFGYRSFKNFIFLFPFLRGPFNAIKVTLKDTLRPNYRTHSRFPEWLKKEWQAAHEIENQIFPTEERLAETPIYYSDIYDPGILFKQMVDLAPHKSDVIIFVPYLKTSGADIVAINYAKVLSERLNKKVTVIATGEESSPWVSQLPQNVDFINFGELAEGYKRAVRRHVLSRYVVQSKAKTLLNIHSPTAFALFRQYQKLFKENGYKLYASAFLEHRMPDGRRDGQVHDYLPDVFDLLDGIFTDNQMIINQLADEYNYPKDKFHVHYQPTAEPHNTSDQNRRATKRILWAGRITQQKRPDIAFQIANLLPEDYMIDLFGVMDEKYDASMLSSPRARYMGPFDGFESLPYQDYDMLLLTSEAEGLPNMLLETAAHGLPIVAPNVGGVGELIKTGTTGELIERFDDLPAYVKAIKNLSSNQELRVKYSKGLQSAIKKHHSWESFEAQIREDIK